MQALADYAELMFDLKTELKARDSAVIGFGGSYGERREGVSAPCVYTSSPAIACEALSQPTALMQDPVLRCRSSHDPAAPKSKP